MQHTSTASEEPDRVAFAGCVSRRNKPSSAYNAHNHGNCSNIDCLALLVSIHEDCLTLFVFIHDDLLY